MTDRPIIFSPPMVRALLEGRKTQTRRLATSPLRLCAAGDRLYVRENFFVMSDDYGWEDYVTRQGCAPDRTIGYIADRADGPMVEGDWEPPANAKRVVHGRNGGDDSEAWTLIGSIPSIYMPRWASRLTLIVDDVRIERLRSISGHDSRCEGVERDGEDWKDYSGANIPCLSARESYATLWDGLHTAEGERWQDNPAVVALTFRVERENVDRIAL